MSGSIEKIGERICALRKAHGLTQETLGEQLGVSGQAVSKWEKGGIPDTCFLLRLAEVFSVTTDELLGLEPPPKSYTKEEVLRLLADVSDENKANAADECFDAVWSIMQKAAKSSRYSNFRDKQEQYIGKALVKSEYCTDNGTIYLSFDEDFPILWTLRDADGITERLLKNKNMWQFLEDLGNTDFQRLLLFTQSQEDSHSSLLTVNFLSKKLKIPADHMQELVDKFISYSLMVKQTAKIDEKDMVLYNVCENRYVLPMLMLTSLVCPLSDGGNSICARYARSKPYFDRGAVESALTNGEL